MSKTTTEPRHEIDIRARAGYEAALFAAKNKLASQERGSVCPGCGWPMMHRYIGDNLHSYTCEICDIAMFTRVDDGKDELDAAEKLGVLV